MVRRRTLDEDAAEGTTPGRKLPGVENPTTLAFSSRGNPTSAASHTVTHHKISVHSLRVSIGLRRPSQSRHRQPSTRTTSRAIAAARRRQSWSLPWPSRSGLASWARSSRVRANAPVTLVNLGDRSWERAEVTSGHIIAYSHQIAIPYPPLLVYCVSCPSYFFFPFKFSLLYNIHFINFGFFVLPFF